MMWHRASVCSWFEIKKDSKFHNQQLYIFTMIQRKKQQAGEIQSVVFKNLKYLLPENVLYSMLKTDDLEVQKTAHKKILSVRCEQPAKKRLKKITAIKGGGVWGLKMVNYCCLNENEIVQS